MSVKYQKVNHAQRIFCAKGLGSGLSFKENTVLMLFSIIFGTQQPQTRTEKEREERKGEITKKRSRE